MLAVENLERRDLLAALTSVDDGGSAAVVVGNEFDSQVVVKQLGRRTVVDTTDFVNYSTSFENLNGDRSDVTDFVIGESPFSARFTGGAAGTRGFRPGYNTGAFAFITSGMSQIDFETPVHVQFAAKDIVELGDVVPGFENVVGTVTLVGTGGNVTLDVPNVGGGQNDTWTKFDSRDYRIGLVKQILVSNVDENGDATGVTNLDDLSFNITINQRFDITGSNFLYARLGAGDDVFVNQTSLITLVFAGDGDDILIGGNSYDLFFGENGRDILFGGNGVDFLNGGDGDDILVGGGGRDFLVGGGGRDLIFTDALDIVFADDDDDDWIF